jgi:hypothetical protein
VRHSGIAVVAAAALALAACGSSGSTRTATTTPTPNGRQVVLASVERTAAADSAKVSLDMSFAGLGRSGMSVTADGEVDFASGDSQMTMDFGGMLGSFLPSGIETRSLDGVVYMRMPIGLPSGKEWVAIDTKKFGDLDNGGGNTALGVGGGSDPTKMLAYLEKVSDGVEEVGTEKVRGVETTHYSARVDLAKAIDRADVPPRLRDAVDELAGKVGAVPVDLWIDGDGLLRRQQMEMDFASFVPGAGGATGATGAAPNMKMTLEFFDFGTPVSVEAPPADQVAMLGEGGFAGGGEIDSNSAAA